MTIINNWVNHSMGTMGRTNLINTDQFWNDAYKSLISVKDEEYDEFCFTSGLLYRVHTGGNSEPVFEDYLDYGEEADRVFKREYDFWIKQNDVNAIEWHNHWVSFTDSVDVINSAYFSGKGLRGFVIVIQPKKAINVYPFKPMGFDEREVVAPMDKNTLIEVLPFVDFIDKYKEKTIQ